MNLGLDKFFQPVESNASLLAKEVNYWTASNRCDEALRDAFEFTNAVDNVLSITAVADCYGSHESIAVIRSLVGTQLAGYSMEGFISDTWDKFIKLIKKVWGAIRDFFKGFWNKISSLFTKKKASSPAAQKFAKAHPEAKKAVMLTKDEQDARDEQYERSEAKYEEWKKANSRHDSPAAVAEVCAAAPSVPVPPKAKEVLKMPKPDKIVTMARLLVADINLVLEKMGKEYELAMALGDQLVDAANARNPVTGESKEMPADLVAMFRTQTPKDLMAFYGTKGMQNIVTNPREALTKILMVEAPNKLGDIAAAHRAIEAGCATLRPAMERLNNEEQRMTRAYEGMQKRCKETAKLPNQLHHEIQQKLTGIMSKMLIAVTAMFKGIKGYSTYLLSIDQQLSTRETEIFSLESAGNEYN